MDEAVAMQFAADVEEAVASIQELSGSAQELAGTAKEAADSVAGVGLAADEASVEAGVYVDAMGRMRDANGRFVASAKAAGDAATGSAAKSDAAAAGHGRLKLALVGVAVAAGLAVVGAAQFQAQTTRLVTSAGELPSNLAMVQEGMLKISAATATSTSEMAGGMYTVESAGFHGAQGLIVLKAAAQGAKDEGAQLSVVANAVTDALVDFHQPASAAANVTSQLITAVSFGKTNFEEFSSSMANVLPLAAAMHLKLADVTGVLAEMTAHGMSAQRASEDEANAMRSLMAPTSVMRKEYALLGISAQQVQAHLGKVGLSGTMQWLSQVAKEGAGAVGQNYTQALDKLMGTAPGLVTALMTTGANAKDTTKAIKGIAGASADAKGNVDGFSKVQQTLAFKTQAAGESLKAAAITLGMSMLPAVVAILGPITHMLQLIAGNKVAADALAVVVGGVLAGALGGKLAGAFKDVKAGVEGASTAIEWLIGKMTATTAATEAQTVATEAQTVASEAEAAAATEADVAMDANPIGLIILAIIALVVAVYELVRHWKTVWHFVTSIVDDVIHWLAHNWPLVLAILAGPIGIAVYMIVKYWNDIKKWFSEGVGAVLGFLKAHWALIVDILIGPIGMAVRFVITHWDSIRHETAHLVDDLVNIFFKLPWRVLTALGNTANTLFSAGWNLIVGLWNGINGMLGQLYSYVSHIASNISGAFSSALHIFSPSRVFYEHGRNTLLGYIQGLMAAAPLVHQAIAGIGGSIASGGLGIGLGGGASGTTPSVHVQVPVTMQGVAQLYNTPQFLQYMQTIVQEAVLRYQLNNPSSGLLAPGRGF